MSEINNKTEYPNQSIITEEDFLIGTENEGKKTKSFSFLDIGNFIKGFLQDSTEKSATFGSFVFGFGVDGKAIKVPVEEFQGVLIGTLEGDYTEPES